MARRRAHSYGIYAPIYDRETQAAGFTICQKQARFSSAASEQN
jgi:hypothetical protein